MKFDDVILGRRSIRGYKPDPVPRALIKEVIGAGDARAVVDEHPALEFLCHHRRAAGSHPPGQHRAHNLGRRAALARVSYRPAV